MNYLVIKTFNSEDTNTFCKDQDAVYKALASERDLKNVKLYEVKEVPLVQRQAVVPMQQPPA
jgi:hypothetical protein